MTLFDSCEPERLALPDAQVSLWRVAPLNAPPEALFSQLLAQTPWQEEDIVLYGKRYQQPRLVAWYGDKGRSYTYSGVTHNPLPWTPCLRQILQDVEHITNQSFNTVLLNHYRNHRDSMGLHADDEPELGACPIIASLSLGEERTLLFRHKHDKSVPAIKIPLPSGSLLLMSGATQQNWKHGIAKERHPCAARINLTFRTIL